MSQLLSKVTVTSCTFYIKMFNVSILLLDDALKPATALTTDLYSLDTLPPIHVVWNYVGTDKLTTANCGTFTSSAASLSSQSR